MRSPPNLGVSKSQRPKNGPQHVVVLVIGTPNKGPLMLGNSLYRYLDPMGCEIQHHGLGLQDVLSCSTKGMSFRRSSCVLLNREYLAKNMIISNSSCMYIHVYICRNPKPSFYIALVDCLARAKELKGASRVEAWDIPPRVQVQCCVQEEHPTSEGVCPPGLHTLLLRYPVPQNSCRCGFRGLVLQNIMITPT